MRWLLSKFGRLEGEDALGTRKQLPRKIIDYDLGDLILATPAPRKPYVSFFSEAFEELACSRNSVGGTHFIFVSGLEFFECWIWGISCFGVLDIDVGGDNSP